MKRLSMLFLLSLLVFSLSACTENDRARRFGGTMTVELQPGMKLMEATWKDNELWYLYRPMRKGENPETLYFQEDSKYGLMTGTVVFKESKKN